MSAERTALRMMLVVAALTGAAWFVVRAARLALDAGSAMPAGRARELILLCGVAALVLGSFAASTVRVLRRTLLVPSRSSAPES